MHKFNVNNKYNYSNSASKKVPSKKILFKNIDKALHKLWSLEVIQHAHILALMCKHKQMRTDLKFYAKYYYIWLVESTSQTTLQYFFIFLWICPIEFAMNFHTCQFRRKPHCVQFDWVPDKGVITTWILMTIYQIIHSAKIVFFLNTEMSKLSKR